MTPNLLGSGYFPARRASVLVSTYWLHGIPSGYKSKKTVGRTSRHHLMESNPTQLCLSEEWNTRTFLDVLNPIGLQEAVMSENLDLDTDSAKIRYRTLTGFSFPFSSFALVTLNTGKADEVTPKIIE